MIEFLVFACGLIFGSFFNVIIYRLPREENFVLDRSKCPQCKAQLKWFHNIPVFSFFFLRAKCFFCKKPISWQYPLVELATSGLWLLTYLQFGLTVDFFLYLVFVSSLIIITVIDFHHQIIPDEISLSGIVLGFVASFFLKDPGAVDSFIGILLGGGLFLLVAYLYEKATKREGLGGGDIKFLGMLGAWLGYKSILLIIVMSSLMGTIVGILYMIAKKKNFQAAIPFGPFLALAGLIYLFFREPLLLIIYPIQN